MSYRSRRELEERVRLKTFVIAGNEAIANYAGPLCKLRGCRARSSLAMTKFFSMYETLSFPLKFQPYLRSCNIQHTNHLA